jgi:hypothetical protein
MFRKLITAGLLVTSGLLVAPPDANAVWINGVWYAKGAECEGEATVKNVDKNKVTIACNVDLPDTGNPNVVVVCQNPGGNISTGLAFVHLATFDPALTVGQISDLKKGKTTYDAIVNASGVNPPPPTDTGVCTEGDLYCYCDNDEACRNLRDQACPNHNWLPIDATPIEMKATSASYYCVDDSTHQCPCDPTITNPSDPKACASALCSGKNPYTFDYTGSPVPLAYQVQYCDLPNPATWRFGEKRKYNCPSQNTTVLAGSCEAIPSN